MAGGGRVIVGAAVGGRVAVVAGTAVPTAAISVGEFVSEALTVSGDSSPLQATKPMARINKRMS